MSKVKVAVLGYGHLGKWHCQKADGLEQAELVSIVEPFEANQKAAKENYPNAKIVNDVKEVINDIDAAVIVTPTSTHFELTKFLLENNKHVFCEKPLCSTFAEVQSLKDYIKEDKVLQVGHSERCHKVWSELEKEFSNIDSHFSIDINRVASFKGRATDVDVVQDLMIHDLDLVMFLFNKKPHRLKAFGHKVRTGKWDHATCILEYDDGSYASITSGRNHVKEVRDLEVMHDGGCIYVDLFRNAYSVATSSQYDDGSYVKEYEYEKRDHLLIEHDNFYNSILGKEKPMVNYNDGSKIVYLIDKVIESLDKKDFVSLDL
jgi:predicted dehydrogenase